MPGLDQYPCCGKNLDKLIQPSILVLLAGESLHGYAIVQKITQEPIHLGETPDASGIYRFLKIMEGRGLVSSTWEIGDAGPPKRIFSITPEGTACLDRWMKTLREYQAFIDRLLNSAHGLKEVRSGGAS